jgi:hypothetical protein
MSQLTVQLPDQLIADARKLAEREHLSVEDFVACLVAQTVQANAAWAKFLEGRPQVSHERFLEILSMAPDVEPDPSDRIE